MSFKTLDDEFNSTLQFYYLYEEKESSGYDLYKGGGYFGVTPSSWQSEMGVFHQFRHLKQEDDLKLDLYTLQQVIGLEMHHSSQSSLNYLHIGGYNESIVTDPTQIKWMQSFCSQHWEVYMQSIQFADTMLLENDRGIKTRISIEEKGIVIQQRLWKSV